jgi:hypothetical protein
MYARSAGPDMGDEVREEKSSPLVRERERNSGMGRKKLKLEHKRIRAPEYQMAP